MTIVCCTTDKDMPEVSRNCRVQDFEGEGRSLKGSGIEVNDYTV